MAAFVLFAGELPVVMIEPGQHSDDFVCALDKSRSLLQDIRQTIRDERY